MTQIRRTVFIPLAVALIAGCPGSDPAGPPWRVAPSEPLALTISTRLPGADDPAPVATVTGGAGAIAIDVRRDAECNVRADAVMRRSRREIDIIAHVGTNGIAACAEVPVVLTYQAEVMGLEAGLYRVRLYETFGGGPARLVLNKSVTVQPPPE